MNNTQSTLVRFAQTEATHFIKGPTGMVPVRVTGECSPLTSMVIDAFGEEWVESTSKLIPKDHA